MTDGVRSGRGASVGGEATAPARTDGALAPPVATSVRRTGAVATDVRTSGRAASAPAAVANQRPVINGTSSMRRMHERLPPTEDAKLARYQGMLTQRIAMADAAIADPKSRVQQLAAGQALVEVAQAPAGGGLTPKRTLMRIDSVDGGRVSVTEIVSRKQRTMSEAEFRALITGGTTLRESADIDAPVVKTLHDRETAFKPLAERALEATTLQRTIGTKAYTIYANLQQRRDELVGERAQLNTQLAQWIEQNRGITSMSRLIAAAVHESASDMLTAARNPEYMAAAPQRAAIVKNDSEIAEAERAMASVKAGEGFTFVPKGDPIVQGLYTFATRDAMKPALADQLRINAGMLRGALDAGNLADAKIAQVGSIQPYMLAPTKSGDSLYRVGRRATSLYAINALIAKGEISGLDKPIISTAELRDPKTIAIITRNWNAIQHQRDALDPSSIRPTNWVARFSSQEYDAELRQLAEIEKTPELKEAFGYVAYAQQQQPRITALEPTWTTKAKNGLYAVLDSPRTWETMAIGIATMGVGGLVLTGARGGLAGLELINAARAAGASGRAAMLLARGTGLTVAGGAIDATLIHSGVNLLNLALDTPSQVDFTTGGYLEAIAMYGVGELVGIGHVMRLGKMGTEVGAGRVAAEHARYALEDAASSTAASVVSAKIHGGDTTEAIAGNAPFVVGTHAVRAARSRSNSQRVRETAATRDTTLPTMELPELPTQPQTVDAARRATGPVPQSTKTAVPSGAPRYLGASDGTPVRVYDDGTLVLGDTAYTGGSYDRNLQAVRFEDGAGDLYLASLNDDGAVGIRNISGVAKMPDGRRVGVADSEFRSAQGMLVERVGLEPVPLGLAASPDGVAIAASLDPTSPFTPLLASALRHTNAPPETVGIGAASALRPNETAFMLPVDAGSRVAMFKDGTIAQVRGNEWVFDDGRILAARDGAGGVELTPKKTPFIHGTMDGSVRWDGRRLALAPAKDAGGVAIALTPRGEPVALFEPDAAGRPKPLTLESGEIRDVSAAGDHSGLRAVAVGGPDGATRTYKVTQQSSDGRFVVLQDADRRFWSGRTGPYGKVVAIESAATDGTMFVMSGSTYGDGARAAMPDGRQVVFARRTGGDGPSWRIFPVDGAPVDLMPSGGKPNLVLKTGEGLDADSPTIIIDNGDIFDVVFAPDTDITLSARVVEELDDVGYRLAGERGTVLGPMLGAYGDIRKLRAALADGRWSDIERQMQREDYSVPPGGVRQQLWTAFGMSSAQRDPMIYATRVGSVGEAQPKAPQPSGDAEHFNVDADGDIRLYEQTPNGMVRVPRDVAAQRFDTILPSLDGRPGWTDLTSAPVTITDDAWGGGRSLTVTPAGGEPHRIRVDDIPPGKFPTIEDLASDLAAMPVAAQLAVQRVAFGAADADALGFFDHRTSTLLIPEHSIWSDPRFVENRRTTLAHEIAGHGIEGGDPIVHRALMLGRYLDGTGTTRPYGGTNVVESFAVGIEEFRASSSSAWGRTPHATRLKAHLLRDRSEPATQASRRGLGNPAVSGQPMLPPSRATRALDENAPVLALQPAERAPPSDGRGARYSGMYDGKPFSVFDNGTIRWGDGVFRADAFVRDARRVVFRDASGSSYIASLRASGKVIVEPLSTADRGAFAMSLNRGQAPTIYGVGDAGLVSSQGRLFNNAEGRPTGVSVDAQSARALETFDPNTPFASDIANALRGATDVEIKETTSGARIAVVPAARGTTYWITDGNAYRLIGDNWLVDGNNNVRIVNRAPDGRVSLDDPPQSASRGPDHLIVDGRYMQLTHDAQNRAVGRSVDGQPTAYLDHGDNGFVRVNGPDGVAPSVRAQTAAKGISTTERHGRLKTITEDGVELTVRFEPDDASAMATRLDHMLRGPQVRFPVALRAYMERLNATVGSDADIISAISRMDRGKLNRARRPGEADVYDQLWNDLGMATAQQDPFIYATKPGTVAEPILFVRENGALRRATRDEIAAQFDRVVPKGPTYAELPRAEVTIDARVSGLGGRTFNVRVPGQAHPHTIHVERIPGGDYPTAEQLALYLSRMPATGATAVRRIRFPDEQSGALASFYSETGILEIQAGTFWKDPSVTDPQVVMDHEATGHGTEASDPRRHRVILMSRVLDGVGTTRKYGETSVHESHAVGIEEIGQDEAGAMRRTPHYHQAATAIVRGDLRFETPQSRVESRRSLVPQMLLAAALAFGFTRDQHRDDETR